LSSFCCRNDPIGRGNTLAEHGRDAVPIPGYQGDDGKRFEAVSVHQRVRDYECERAVVVFEGDRDYGLSGKYCSNARWEAGAHRSNRRPSPAVGDAVQLPSTGKVEAGCLDGRRVDIRPWVGKGADPIPADLKNIARSLQTDTLEPWRETIQIKRISNLDDGWAHARTTRLRACSAS
jgi:hypothetical protein